MISILLWLNRGDHLQLGQRSLSRAIEFFLLTLARSRYLSLFSLSFIFTQWSAGQVKHTIRLAFLFFPLTMIRSVCLAEIRLSVCVTKSQRIFNVFVSSTCLLYTLPWKKTFKLPCCFYELAKWLECSPMARETEVQSQVKSYQRLKKWYLIPPCLTLSIIRDGSRVKWSNVGKGVARFLTPRCSSYQKVSLRVTLD